MATKGSFNTSAYDGRYYNFAWEVVEQSPGDNATYIKWTLSAKGGNSNWYAEYELNLTIDGKKAYSKTNRVERYKGTVASGTATLVHNEFGYKEFSVYINAQVYTANGFNCTGSANYTLDYISQRAYITSAPNFNDTQYTLVVEYTNPSREYIEVCIANTDGVEILVPYRAADIDNGSIWLFLTEDEMAALIGSVKEGYTNSIRFYIRTLINGMYYLSSVYRTFTITDAAPQINPSASNDKYNYTGNDIRIIRGISQIYYDIHPTVYKQATIKSISVTSPTVNRSTQTGFIENFADDYLDFTLVDSRNNKVTKRINFDVVEYFKPTCVLKSPTYNLNDEELIINLEASGIWFNGSFGAVDNSITVSYRYKLYDGTYSSWTPMETYISGNNYIATASISGLNYQETYVVECRVMEVTIYSTKSAEHTVKSIPVFDWGSSDFAFNVPISIQGNNVIDFPIEEGTEAMGSNGTWYWRKWKSGRAECFGVRNFGNMAVTTAFGTLFQSSSLTQSLPTGLFVDTPEYIDMAFRSGNYSGWVVKGTSEAATKDAVGNFIVVRPTSTNIQQVHIGFNVIGRWK